MGQGAIRHVHCRVHREGHPLHHRSIPWKHAGYAMLQRAGAHFAIENEKVSEIELMPNGADGRRVTNADWTRSPTSGAPRGIRMDALARPWPSRTPRYPTKTPGQWPKIEITVRASTARPMARVPIEIEPVPRDEAIWYGRPGESIAVSAKSIQPPGRGVPLAVSRSSRAILRFFQSFNHC